MIRSDHPWHTITVDLMFAQKDAGTGIYTTILHVVDNFTCFSFLRICKDKSPKEIASKLYELFADQDIPAKIIMDNGSEFSSKLSQQIYQEILGLIRAGGSSYHPQTQGVNEVRHKKIKQLLRTELLHFANSIEEVLPLVQLKLNLCLTRRHNSCPFALFHGRAPNSLPINNSRYSHMSWAQRLALMGTVIHPKLKIDMESYFSNIEKLYAKRHAKAIAKSQFKPGDRVKIKSMTKRNVIVNANESHFKGAFIIKNKVAGGYNVTREGTDEVVNLEPIPIEQISSFNRQANSKLTLSPTEEMSDEQWIFKQILGHQIEPDGTILYKVKWDDNSTTLEPATSFAGDRRPLNQYWRLFRSKKV